MSVINGNSPELIVKNGLVLNLDAGNRNSYISGTDAWYDLSGNNINGNIISASFLAMPTFNSYNGGSLTFDGADDAANASISGSVEFSEFTVNAWIRLSSSTTSGTHAAVGALLNAFRLGVFNNYKLMFGVNSSLSVGLTIPNTPTLETGSWYMITGVLGQSTLTAYLNGNFAASTSSFISSIRPPSEFNLVFIGYGFRSNAWLFRGDIAQVQLYGRALSASEILQNYNANKSRFTTSSLAVSTVPKVPTNGLVFEIDAANPKSYVSGSTNIYDISPTNLSGSLINGVGYSSTNKGSLTFDGTNDFVQIPDNPVFNFGSNDFTFNIILKSCKDNVVIYAQSNQNGYSPLALVYNTTWTAFSYWASSDGINWNIFASELQTSGSLNVWTDLTLTRNGNVWTSYKDGQFVNSKTYAGTLYDSSDSMKIGARTGAYASYASGSISSVRIYNRALSANEVRSMYDATKGRYGL